ncbi:MAG: FMN-binding negative transcriptional regulator [Alphaproteobacteria bacterium]
MYVPTQFAESDPAQLAAIMRDAPFATLVTVVDGAPFATHLPLLHETESGTNGRIVGHMARQNPHWRSFGGSAETLAIFHGPHAYVSPTWYAAQPSVPTWNYAVVHAYGRPSIVEDAARARTLLDRLIAAFEADWSLTGLPPAYVEGMMRGIVTFEMPVARIEGKAKLSQNRTADDRARVARRLAGAPDTAEARTGAMMTDATRAR